MTRLLPVLCLLLFFCSSSNAADTVPSAGLKAAGKEDKKKKQEEDAITILGQRLFKDAELMGPYRQPEWSTARRFSSTKVYVLPPGSATFEYTLGSKGRLETDSAAKFRSNYELELGLGAHLQLDLLLFTEQSEGYAPLKIAGEQIELRWALADWGVLWGNPTLYFEWIRRHEKPQKLEGKLLLGDAFGPRLYWGLNFVYERELGAEAEQEYGISSGLSYSLVDGFISLGLEAKCELADKVDSRFDFSEIELLIGPALQIRPLPGLHISLVPLFGVEWEDEARPVYAVFFIIGKDFGLRQMAEIQQTEIQSMPSHIPSTPWKINYHDGSNNGFSAWQESPGADLLFTYSPTQAEHSSSGHYSGGEPKQGKLSLKQCETLWRQVIDLESDKSLHAASRMMGTGAFKLAEPTGERGFVIKRGAGLETFEDLISGMMGK
ncbi:MAG: hypothetical protein JRF33_08445 [Deltaproteobacteria bacterium]|nr:hypothetical protein [Deltaproteobacteria bacterium]